MYSWIFAALSLVTLPPAQHFSVHYGPLTIGHATLQVTPATRDTSLARARLTIEGRFMWLSVNDTVESTFDPKTFTSHRFRQILSEGGHHRQHDYVMFRAWDGQPAYYVDSLSRLTPHQSVVHPIDDLSALYWAFASPMDKDTTLVLNRYFKPEHNPITFTVRHTVLDGQSVIDLSPNFHTGLMAQGHAHLYIDPVTRLLHSLTLKLPVGTLTLIPDEAP